jgi:spore maturation protein CgeB
MNTVILGLSITSSWGNGHATTYRGLVRELTRRGHSVLFLERDVPWYAAHRDLPAPPYGRTELYGSVGELRERFGRVVRDADLVMVGSYVPDGIAVGEWVVSAAEGITAFYDIDTPVTLAKLERGEAEYLTPELIRRYRLYLSFTGGPILDLIERRYGSPMARVLYCSADTDAHRPEAVEQRWDLGYIGTYSADRQPFLDCLLMEPARRWAEGRFVVAGPLYPEDTRWPRNVERMEHLAPDRHRKFYNSQRLTLNITRADMKAAGYSPSVRLFEAAACGTPIVSDAWKGLDSIFEVGREVLVAGSPEEVLRYVHGWPEADLRALGEAARSRVLAAHTAAHRARELEAHFEEAVAHRTTV